MLVTHTHTCKQFHKLFVTINWIVSLWVWVIPAPPYLSFTSHCICGLFRKNSWALNPRETFSQQLLHICWSFWKKTLSPLNEPRGRIPGDKRMRLASCCVLANNLMRYDICANNFCAVLHIIENHIHAPWSQGKEMETLAGNISWLPLLRFHFGNPKALCFAGQFRGQYPAVKYAVISLSPFVPYWFLRCIRHWI